jgi:hypothetical protein
MKEKLIFIIISLTENSRRNHIVNSAGEIVGYVFIKMTYEISESSCRTKEWTKPQSFFIHYRVVPPYPRVIHPKTYRGYV